MNKLGEFLGDLFGDVLRPLRVLLVAALGLVVALFLFNDEVGVVAWLLIAAVLVAFVCGSIGERLLPSCPRAGLFFMEFWVVAPSTITVVISGIAIVVGVKLTPADSASAAAKEIISTAGAAVAAFFGAMVSWVGEKDDTRVADRIRQIFYRHYKRPNGKESNPRIKIFRPESRGELAVYSGAVEGITGWGLSDRWGRAAIIAEELSNNKSNPFPHTASPAPAPRGTAAPGREHDDHAQAAER